MVVKVAGGGGKGSALRHLQHNATHCNTMQRTATHCNTLQHTMRLIVSLSEPFESSVLQCVAVRCTVMSGTLLQNVVSFMGLFCKRDL